MRFHYVNRATRANFLALLCLMISSLSAAPVRDVVLIHGILDTPWTMRKLDRCLKEAGFTTHVIKLKPATGVAPLEVLAAQVRDVVEADIAPGDRFSVVGFSMGGVIARYYAQRLADPDRIDALVTISTPHCGTWLAYVLPFSGVRQMRPRSALLRDLDDDVEEYGDIRWVTIRTPLDLIIVPSSSSRLDWAENHSFPVLMHPLMVFDDRVINEMIRVLRSDGEVGRKQTRAAESGKR